MSYFKLVCDECGAELVKRVDEEQDRIWVSPCDCQKPKHKPGYEPVFLEAKGIGGLPHD